MTRQTRPRRHGTALTAAGRAIVTTAVLAGLLPLNAFAAAWTTSPIAPSQTISSATLTPPGGLAASCRLFSFRVTLNWTPDPSAVTTGYAILRATATTGPYTVVATVTGGSTSTYNDPTVSAAANYYYEIESTHLLWTSPPSANVNVLTVLGLCT